MVRRLTTLGLILGLAFVPLSATAANHGDVLWITPMTQNGWVNHVPPEWCAKDGTAAYCWGSNGHGNTVGVVFTYRPSAGATMVRRGCFIDYDYVNKIPHLRGVRPEGRSDNCKAQLVGKQIQVW